MGGGFIADTPIINYIVFFEFYTNKCKNGECKND